MTHRIFRFVAGVVVCLFMCSGAAYAGPITYEAFDLDDTIAGEDLWMYRYVLSADPFLPDHGFAIFFDSGLYSELVTTAVPDGWDVLLFQPNLVPPMDGIFDALDLAGGSLLGPFDITFVWRGMATTSPGAQPYEFYRLDTGGSYALISDGLTAPAVVPEPGTLILLSIGLAGVAAARRRL